MAINSKLSQRGCIPSSTPTYSDTTSSASTSTPTSSYLRAPFFLLHAFITGSLQRIFSRNYFNPTLLLIIVIASLLCSSSIAQRQPSSFLQQSSPLQQQQPPLQPRQQLPLQQQQPVPQPQTIDAADKAAGRSFSSSLRSGMPNVCSYQMEEMRQVQKPCIRAFTRLVKVWKPACAGGGGNRQWCVGYERKTAYYTTYEQVQQVSSEYLIGARKRTFCAQ